MNTLQSLFTFACFTLATTAFAQPASLEGNLQFTLKKVGATTWGVFVLPDNTIAPSARTTVGAGQVTLVAPIDFTYSNLENMGGSWVENARVDGPVEAFDKAYISFGFVTDSPKLQLFPYEESLLFTIEVAETFDGTFTLFENGNDPFAVPNSYESNPGNDIGVIDYGVEGGLQYYAYAGNYGQAESTPAILAKNKTKKSKKAKAVLTSGHAGDVASPKNPK